MDNTHILKDTPNLGVKVAFHGWRILFSGSSEVGYFRLKDGTDYLNREMEFSPLAPIALKGSKLGDYLARELQDLEVEIQDEGGVTLRLGPNKRLGPVAGKIAFAYKLMQPSAHALNSPTLQMGNESLNHQRGESG